MTVYLWVISVKCSNSAASPQAGFNDGQTDIAKIHLGQGEAGYGNSRSFSFWSEGPQTFAPDKIKFYPVGLVKTGENRSLSSDVPDTKPP